MVTIEYIEITYNIAYKGSLYFAIPDAYCFFELQVTAP